MYCNGSVMSGLDKNQILAFSLSNLHFNSNCLKLFWAQISVNGQMSHEKFPPCLPIRQVTDKICLPNRKSTCPRLLGHGFFRALNVSCGIVSIGMVVFDRNVVFVSLQESPTVCVQLHASWDDGFGSGVFRHLAFLVECFCWDDSVCGQNVL